MDGEWGVARGDGGWQGGVAGTQLGLGGARQVAGGAQGARLGGRSIKLASKGEEERSWHLLVLSLLSTQVHINYFLFLNNNGKCYPNLHTKQISA